MPCFTLPPLTSANDWNGFQTTPPCSPLKLIAFARLQQDSVVKVGALHFDDAILKVTTWLTEQPMLRTSAPACLANDATDGNLVANASQWNFQHNTAPGAGIAPPLQDTVFMRAGELWTMRFGLDCRSHAFSVIGLTFLKNMATRGDAQGTVPMILFSNGDGFSDEWQLDVTLKAPGSHALMFVGWSDHAGDPEVACQLTMNWEVVS